jgi:hypothetical protein
LAGRARGGQGLDALVREAPFIKALEHLTADCATGSQNAYIIFFRHIFHLVFFLIIQVLI